VYELQLMPALIQMLLEGAQLEQARAEGGGAGGSRGGDKGSGAAAVTEPQEDRGGDAQAHIPA
jgi:hypothetical protein